MALFLKQNFSPPLLSRRWIIIKFRPNVLLYSREHVICILESGLLFREDSAAVEQECPSPEKVWAAAGGGARGWCTRGERGAALLAVAACALSFPPKSLDRGALARLALSLASGVAARGWLRCRARGVSRLPALLDAMRRYMALARRAQACVRDNAVHSTLGSVAQALGATHELLRRQQAGLAARLARASAALLGTAPWLRADVAWAALPGAGDPVQKIHHAFLVVQSTFLKHVAMAHFPQPSHPHVYKNHNERLYWTHTVLLQHLLEEFEDNYEALDRMYRIFKNYGSKDFERKSFPINDRWLYSEVHSGIARTGLELKMALEKCTKLDMFLDSCAINDQELNLDVLNDDIDDLIEELTKCLGTMQGSQIRLKKLQRKFAVEEEKKESDVEEEEDIIKIEDKPIEVKDEVFYLLKTDDDNERDDIADVITAPGKKEKEATRFMLNELKRKLVKREDMMRERERQALVKTMPELKDVPEFPRQMEDYIEKRGYIKKILKDNNKDKLFKDYKIGSKATHKRKYKLNVNKYENESEIKDAIEANANLSAKSKIISVCSNNNEIILTKWNKKQVSGSGKESKGFINEPINKNLHPKSSYSSDKESERSINQAINNNVNNAVNKIHPKAESSYSSDKESEYSISQAINNTVNDAVNKTINQAVNKLHPKPESSYSSEKESEGSINPAINNTVNKTINQAVNKIHPNAESSYSSEKESEGSISQTINNTVNKTINQAVNKQHPKPESSYSSDKESEGSVNKTNEPNMNFNKELKFTKKDLELSSSESDFDHEHQMALLKDIRRHRVARKKNHPVKRVSIDVDESLKPIEYSFGTGMAMASMLQVNNTKIRNMAEEVFIGDGEVSDDSGNDEEA